MNKTRVVPAILTDKPDALKTMVRQVESFTDYVQIDIMDGIFVPSRSITPDDVVGLSVKVKWEAHLMVNEPQKYFDAFRKAGAGRVIFHLEAAPEPQKVIAAAKSLGLKAGIAINPETAVDKVLPLVEGLDSVLFLSVHPGFYGAKFIPEVLDKIVEFRRLRPDKETGIDGGVKATNIAEIARSGVSVIYVGSAIFLQPRPAESYRNLVELANGQR